jgi:hypothetical protein
MLYERGLFPGISGGLRVLRVEKIGKRLDDWVTTLEVRSTVG